jgi:hypothetical protein
MRFLSLENEYFIFLFLGPCFLSFMKSTREGSWLGPRESHEAELATIRNAKGVFEGQTKSHIRNIVHDSFCLNLFEE